MLFPSLLGVSSPPDIPSGPTHRHIYNIYIPLYQQHLADSGLVGRQGAGVLLHSLHRINYIIDLINIVYRTPLSPAYILFTPAPIIDVLFVGAQGNLLGSVRLFFAVCTCGGFWLISFIIFWACN